MYISPFNSPDAAAIFHIRQLTTRLELWTAEIHRELDTKYNPSQPRVPRGNPAGGQWTDGSGGSGIGAPRSRPSATLKPQRTQAPKTPSIRPALSAEELARFNRRAPPGTPPEDLEIDPAFGLPRWYVSGAVSPSASPLDVIGGAAGAVRAAGSLAKTTVSEAAAAVRVLRARYGGGRATEESIDKIRTAADSVEEFLGGVPDRSIFKNNGDMVLTRGEIRVRFDIVKFGNGKEARPHFQIEKRTSPPGARKEKWEDIGEHWYDFADSEIFIKR